MNKKRRQPVLKNAWFSRTLASNVGVMCVVFVCFLLLFYQIYSSQEETKIRQIGKEAVLYDNYLLEEIMSKTRSILQEMQSDEMFATTRLNELAAGKNNAAFSSYRVKMNNFANESYLADVMLYSRASGMSIDKYGVFLSDSFFEYFYNEQNSKEFIDVLKGETPQKIFPEAEVGMGVGNAERCIKIMYQLDRYGQYMVTYFVRVDKIYDMIKRDINNFYPYVLLCGNDGTLLAVSDNNSKNFSGINETLLERKELERDYFVFLDESGVNSISATLLLEKHALKAVTDTILTQMIMIFLLVTGICIMVLYIV